MQNSKTLIVAMVVGLGLLLVYFPVRYRALKKVQMELQASQAQRHDLESANREVAELVRRFGGGADVPAFVEQMHRHAREIGIADDYELSSSQKGSLAGRAGRASQKGAGTPLVVSRMRISLQGEYRDIAAYLRLLQDDRNPKKYIDLKLVQEKGEPRLNVNLELYSHRRGNGV